MVLIDKLKSFIHQTEKENAVANSFSKNTAITFAISAFCLSCIYYFGSITKLAKLLTSVGLEEKGNALLLWLELQNNPQITQLTYWVFVLSVFYLLIPILTVKLIYKENLIDYGFNIKGALKKYKVYVYFFLFMLPLVFVVSFSKSFQSKYPFYDLAQNESLFPNFLLWQILYFIQFIGVEFFFRGFMVHGAKKGIGIYSVFVMTIPYCMIHFGKPMPETIAAIVAGIVLGFLSLKSKSIWLGVAIHYSVAITMDLLSLWQKGYFN